MIGGSCEGKDMDERRWMPGQLNIMDALTRNSFVLWELRHRVSSTGEPEIYVVQGKALDSNDSQWIYPMHLNNWEVCHK